MNENIEKPEVLEKMLTAEMKKHAYLSIPISARLPWGRSFEAVIELKKKYDVIVVGGGSAGVSAAIASARIGSKTLLLEKHSIFGGTNTRSLVGPITSFLGEEGTQIVDGIPQEIIERLIEQKGSLGHITDPIDFCHSLTPVNFKQMQLVLFKMLREQENLEITLNTVVKDTIVKTNKVTCLVCENETRTFTVDADVIVDASGDANVVALASDDYEFGRKRDGNVQPMSMLFTCRGVDLEQIRKDVAKDPSNFTVDKKIQQGKRMTYVAISGYFNEVKNSQDFPLDRDRLLFFQGMNEDEIVINTTRIYVYAKKTMNEYVQEGQQQVYELFAWVKKNIPAFKDAYVSDIGEIGVRESRRIIGDIQLSDEDVLLGREQVDSIAIGSYPVDIHSPDSKGMEFLENNRAHDFEISYRMLLPKTLHNVITAGRSISATHAAHAASRVSATCMAVGQAAGVAAALVASQKILTRELNYRELKEKILLIGGIPTKKERKDISGVKRV